MKGKMELGSVRGMFLLSLAVAAAMAWGLVVAGAATAADPIKMKYAHGFSMENPEGKAGEAIKNYIAASPVLKDRIKFEHYPGGALFSTDEARTAVKSGGLELASDVSSYLSKSIPAYELADLPFLFKSADHFFASMAATKQGQGLLKEAESLGITILCERPSTNFFYKFFNSKRELRAPKDFKGLKLRTAPGLGFTDVTKLLGASTVAMAIPEVVGAFQSNMIDGTLTNENGWTIFRLMEYCKFVTALDINSSYSWYVVNTNWWQKSVPADLRPELIKAVKAGADTYAKASEEQRQKVWGELTKLWKDGKYTVTFLTPDELKQWENTQKPLFEKLGKRFGTELIDKARELAPKYKAVSEDLRDKFKK